MLSKDNMRPLHGAKGNTPTLVNIPWGILTSISVGLSELSALANNSLTEIVRPHPSP